MKNYSIGCWEIDRYEVVIYYNGRKIAENNFFGTEEAAVAYIQNYDKDPKRNFQVFKLMRACFESV